MNFNWFVCFLSLTTSVKLNMAYAILAIFPTPSYSHQIVFQPIIEELATRGHRLTVLTPYPQLFEHENVTLVDLSQLKTIWNRLDFVKAANLPPLEFVKIFVELMEDMFEAIFNHSEVKQFLKRAKIFDAVFCEMLGYTPMYAFAKHFNVPLLGITSMDLLPGHHKELGNVRHPVLHPHFSLPFFGELSFLERCLAVYFDWFLNYLEISYGQRFDRIIRKYFENTIGDSYSISKSMSLAIANAHPALGNVRPIVPTTIQVGFLHIKPVKPLPKVIESFLTKSSQGVIYVSFGSNVKSSNLAPEKVSALVTAFSRLNYEIIWKWESPDLPNRTKNILISQWLPQADILASGKVKLFITQGGQQSLEEAIYYGIPLIAIPFCADQEMNARRIETLKIGQRLTLANLTPYHLVKMVDRVLGNSSYKTQVDRLSVIVKDTPIPGAKLAAWWVEYTIRHNGTHHLRYPAVDMSVWKYHLLDVYLFTAFVVLLLFCLIQISFRWLYSHERNYYYYYQQQQQIKRQEQCQKQLNKVDDKNNKSIKLKAL